MNKFYVQKHQNYSKHYCYDHDDVIQEEIYTSSRKRYHKDSLINLPHNQDKTNESEFQYKPSYEKQSIYEEQHNANIPSTLNRNVSNLKNQHELYMENTTSYIGDFREECYKDPTLWCVNPAPYIYRSDSYYRCRFSNHRTSSMLSVITNTEKWKSSQILIDRCRFSPQESHVRNEKAHKTLIQPNGFENETIKKRKIISNNKHSLKSSLDDQYIPAKEISTNWLYCKKKPSNYYCNLTPVSISSYMSFHSEKSSEVCVNQYPPYPLEKISGIISDSALSIKNDLGIKQEKSQKCELKIASKDKRKIRAVPYGSSSEYYKLEINENGDTPERSTCNANYLNKNSEIFDKYNEIKMPVHDRDLHRTYLGSRNKELYYNMKRQTVTLPQKNITALDQIFSYEDDSREHNKFACGPHKRLKKSRIQENQLPRCLSSKSTTCVLETGSFNRRLVPEKEDATTQVSKHDILLKGINSFCLKSSNNRNNEKIEHISNIKVHRHQKFKEAYNEYMHKYCKPIDSKKEIHLQLKENNEENQNRKENNVPVNKSKGRVTSSKICVKAVNAKPNKRSRLPKSIKHQQDKRRSSSLIKRISKHENLSKHNDQVQIKEAKTIINSEAGLQKTTLIPLRYKDPKVVSKKINHPQGEERIEIRKPQKTVVLVGELENGNKDECIENCKNIIVSAMNDIENLVLQNITQNSTFDAQSLTNTPTTQKRNVNNEKKKQNVESRNDPLKKTNCPRTTSFDSDLSSHKRTENMFIADKVINEEKYKFLKNSMQHTQRKVTKQLSKLGINDTTVAKSKSSDSKMSYDDNPSKSNKIKKVHSPRNHAILQNYHRVSSPSLHKLPMNGANVTFIPSPSATCDSGVFILPPSFSNRSPSSLSTCTKNRSDDYRRLVRNRKPLRNFKKLLIRKAGQKYAKRVNKQISSIEPNEVLVSCFKIIFKIVYNVFSCIRYYSYRFVFEYLLM